MSEFVYTKIDKEYVVLAGFKQWLRARNSPTARVLYALGTCVKYFELPRIPVLFNLLYLLHASVTGLLGYVSRIFYYTPMFKSKTSRCGKHLYLYGGLPYLYGPLRLTLGDRCRLSGKITITSRSSSDPVPSLRIGSNVDIGWQTTIAVGTFINIGNNVRIAGQAFFAGYPGHPVDAKNRALGLPDTDDQAKPITIEDDVWIATNCTILGGVTIGKGTIVAASSVVTKDLPAGVLAAGNPAKPVRNL